MDPLEHGFLREIQLVPDRVESFDQYPYCIPAIRKLETLRLDPRVTFFIGENGSGKSTIVEAIAILAGFNPEGGSKNIRFTARPSESSLSSSLRIVRGIRREKTGFFFRAETLFNLATEIEKQGLSLYGWENLHTKSHGEAFLWLVKERFGAKGLYILDEPESALSPQRQLSLLRLIHELVEAECQLIIATHSPILMAYPGATIYGLDSEGIRAVAYEDTEHYTVLRDFLNNPARWCKHLFDPAPEPSDGQEA